MKEINESKLEVMKVPDVREFLHNIDSATEECTTVKTLMTRAYEPWKAAYDAMVRAYETSLKSDESDEIHTLDYMHDNLLTSVKGATNGFRKSPNAEMREAAEAVWTAFGSFKANPNIGYIAQTAQLDALLSVLLGEHEAALEKLAILPLVQQLAAINQRMHELIEERDIANIEKPDGFRPQARKAAIDAYLFLTKYVNAYHLIVTDNGNPAPGLDAYMDRVNSIIARFKRVVLHQPVEGEEEESPTTPPGEESPTPSLPGGGGGEEGDDTLTNPPTGGGGDNNGEEELPPSLD